jgi:hypothetical protein
VGLDDTFDNVGVHGLAPVDSIPRRTKRKSVTNT